MAPTSTRFVPTRNSRRRVNFNPRRRGKESRGDQSPEAGRNSGVERKFDLARDGSAGVRKSREGMEA